MGYALLALALVGFATGFAFRLKTLLLLVFAVFLLSLAFSFRFGFTLSRAAMTVVILQAVLQSCYLLGLVVHEVLGRLPSKPSGRDISPSDRVEDPLAKSFDGPSKIRRWRRPLTEGPIGSQ
jgi:lysylphosphatidylglycerol synthetase-like protein (DUF2156 family)